MPTILEPSDYEAWLNEETNKDALTELVRRQLPGIKMRVYPVGTNVNTPKNDNAGPVEEATAT